MAEIPPEKPLPAFMVRKPPLDMRYSHKMEEHMYKILATYEKIYEEGALNSIKRIHCLPVAQLNN